MLDATPKYFYLVMLDASVTATNGTSISVTRYLQDACIQNVPSHTAWRHRDLAFFRPLLGLQRRLPASHRRRQYAELIVNTEFTSKLVPFVTATEAANGACNARAKVGISASM